MYFILLLCRLLSNSDSKICDVNRHGLAVFGSKNSLFLMDIHTRKFRGTLTGSHNFFFVLCLSLSLAQPRPHESSVFSGAKRL